MKHFAMFLVLITSVGCAPLPSAEFEAPPTSLGSLLDKGGSRMTKAAIVAELPGTAWADLASLGQVKFDTDGTFAGSGRAPIMNIAKSTFGSWSVNDEGRLCVYYGDITNRGRQVCGFVFQLGTDYFLSRSLSDRATPVFRQRKVSP